ncbi:MAG: putative molybdenum carrier protein [Rhodospirillales bacterium]|nr:putative molybdenum carrier protein [Rhodospirillales bacterium]
MATLKKIVSGGQTGVDQGALEAALGLGFPCGGWCPKGRLSERGTIPGHFPLKETSSSNYPERTELNVRHSDGTLILCKGSLSGGTALTERLARSSGRPCLVVDLDDSDGLSKALNWIEVKEFEILNLAGPRESGSPGIQQAARKFMVALLSNYLDAGSGNEGATS